MPPINEILVLHHAHTDIGYTHPQPVVMELHKRFIDEAIDLCEASADWPEPSRMRWTCEVTSTLQYWLRHSTDKQIERFRQLVIVGQMGAGAMHHNVTPLCHAEQLSRMLLPVKEMREVLGLPMSVAINHDVNGLPWPITQLLLDAGIEMLMMGINIHSGGFPLTRPLAFRWKGCDGRELLAFNGEHYGAFEREARIKGQSLQGMSDGLQAYFKRLEKQSYPHDFVLLSATHPTYTDNVGPSPIMMDMVRKWNAEQREPVIRFVTPEMLLQKLRQLPENALSVHGGDWTDYWNFGCASSAVETRINREARGRLLSAESLMSRQSMPARTLELLAEANTNLDTYDEHTWGAWCSVTNPGADISLNQWMHKAHYAHQAWSLAELVSRDALQARSENPLMGTGVKSLLLHNPAAIPRKVLVTVPKSWLDGSWEHCDNSLYRFQADLDTVPEQQRATLALIELPARGSRVLPIASLSIAPAPSGCGFGHGWIESPSYRLEFDQATGRITSLLDKHLDRQLVDVNARWPLFGFVQETVSLDHQGIPSFQGRDAYFPEDWSKLLVNEGCWNPDWQAARKGPTKLLRCEAAVSPHGAELHLEWEAPGVENLKQKITLFGHKAAVGFEASFDKLDIRTSEGIYFAFPLALNEGWQSHFDTAGIPVEFDQEQLPGVCRDYVTVGSWVAMHDSALSITLACPDAPMVQIGSFSFGKTQTCVARPVNPLLLGWLANNYWTTNFRASQPGYMRCRYELTSRAEFDAVASTQAGQEAASRVECHPILSDSPLPALELIQVTPACVMPIHVKRSLDGTAMMVLLANVSETAVEALVSLPGAVISSAYLSNSLETQNEPLAVCDGRIAKALNPRQLVNLRIMIGG